MTAPGILIRNSRGAPVIILFLLLIVEICAQIQFSFHSDTQGDPHLIQNISGLICNDGMKRSTQFCASSNSDYVDSVEKQRHEFLFTFCRQNVQVYLNQRAVTLPDTLIMYDNDMQIPIFREDVARNLDVFYSGHLVFSNETFPFSGEQSGLTFVGRTFYYGAVLEVVCDQVILEEFLTTNSCIACDLTSVDVTPPNTSVSSVKSYEELLLELNDFGPVFTYKKSPDESSIKENKNARHKGKRTVKIPPLPLTCSLHIVADHLFFKYIGNGNVMETVNTMFSMVNDADSLFRSTDFDGDGVGDNIGFVVGKVTIHKTKNDPSYHLASLYMTSDEYLKQLSLYNFEEHCLAVAFTFRDFNTVAGTSFPGYSNPRTPGGICQKRLRINSHHVSLNTLVVTFMASGKLVPRTTVMLTLSHELGHSMGAQHDGKKCSSADGGYIMSKSSHLDLKPNNRRFSICSIRSMLPVIKKKGFCLHTDIHYPRCGNSIPDVGEECDCGLSNICDSVDPCCTPADHTNGPDKPCTTRKSQGKLCSPKLSPCCSSQCTYTKQDTPYVCNIFDECTQKSYCDGYSEHCPTPSYLPNGSLCSDGLRVCENSRCALAVCSYHQLESCACGAHRSCQLCCRDPHSKFCKPADVFGIRNENGSPIFLKSGAPCGPGKFCNNAQQCVPAKRTVGAMHSVLSSRRENRITSYIKRHWLYCIFLVLSVIFLIGVVINSYTRGRSANVKSLRLRKMLSILASGVRQSSLYRKQMFNIHKHYAESIPKASRHTTAPITLEEAVGRLKTMFPEVTVTYLSRIARLSRTENAAVKLLLMQGFRLRTFSDFRLGSVEHILTLSSEGESESG